MRLITHNLLICNVRSCVGRGAPLRVNAMEITHIPTEMKPEVLQKFVGRINWQHFRETVGELGDGLPETIGEAELANEELLQKVHKWLLDVSPTQTHITTGALVCSSCGRSYPIERGIPNMVLEETET